jgi:hypothetical protein
MCVRPLVLICAATAGAQTGFWAPVEPPRADYMIDARISADGSRLTGQERIRFTNAATRPIRRVALRWWGDQMEVQEADRVDSAGGAVLYDLRRDVQPGESVELKVTFGAPLKWTDEGVISSSLGPKLWWGFSTHDDYTVRFAVPDAMRVATSGRFIDGAWRAAGLRTFGFFVGRKHQIVEADAGDVHVRVLYPAGADKAAGLILKTAADAIQFYRGRFGTYPHRSISVVPGMSHPAGGYPAASALVVIHGQGNFALRPENHWRWITAHEIGHQYWMEHVLADGPDSLNWLMIGLGLYADREYRRARGITDGTGDLWRNYVSGVREGIDTTMDVTPEQEHAIGWDFNNVVAHGKSMALVNSLEDVLGASLFDQFYRRLLQDYGGKRLSWHRFRREAEASSGEDLGWFFDQWVRSPAAVQFASSHDCAARNGTFDCEITVRREGGLAVPVTVAARLEDGTEQRLRADRWPRVQRLRLAAVSRIHTVVIDPDAAVAQAQPPPEPERAIRSRIRDLPWSGAGDAPVQLMQEALSVPIADAGVWRKLAMTLYDGKHYEQALAALEHLDPAFFRLVWEGINLDLLNRRTDALDRYRRALQLPAKPVLTHSQYKLRIDEEWVRHRLAAPFTRQ